MRGSDGSGAGGSPPVTRTQLGGQKRGRAHEQLRRLADCIDRGLGQVAEVLPQVRKYVDDVRAVAATLEPSGGNAQREAQFTRLRERLQASKDPIHHKMARLMSRFQPGLFAGGEAIDLPPDNLDLERWFRQPKSHARRIHGRQHAGVRLVQEGPTLVLALEAHLQHPNPYTAAELRPYRDAPMPLCQEQALHRRAIMRRARSGKNRPILLTELEQRYRNSS